ncbi:MAG: DHH family phosphoesterase [Actinomycetota bacterium]
MRYDLPDWDDAVKVLREADEVALACHVNPDGDALGSLLGASLCLAQLGKKVAASWGAEAMGMPPSYTFLPGQELLVPPEELPSAATFLALDCGAIDRLGSLEVTAAAAERVVNVDHHPGNDDFGDLNLVVPTASSTAELTVRLLEDVGARIDRDIATCFYVGLVTDTGRFQYTNSSPETLRMAADLLSHGVPATEIAQDVFESAPFGYLKLVGRVLERATLLEKERFVYSWVGVTDLDETGVALDETEKLIDLVRSTRDANVAALFKEQPDGTYRVSLRSKGPISVGAIARANGGGGHDLAAGFTAAGVEAAVAEIRAALTS